MFEAVNNFLQHVDDLVWGVPLIVAILLTGIYLTIRLKGIQITKLPKALKYMFENEESGHGEVTSFGALCTALSATIGTGNIVGVATAIVAGGPGALSGWKLQPCLVWQRNIPKVFSLSNTVQRTNMVISLAARFTISKMVMGKKWIHGWQRFLHFSEWV